MKATRRRPRTKETELAKRIRTYARSYEVDGQTERAEGMHQAAAMVDEYMASARGASNGVSIRSGPDCDDLYLVLGSTVAQLEQRVEALERARVTTSTSSSATRKMPAILGPSSSDELRKTARVVESLVQGELEILAAVAQRGEGGVRGEELIAMTDYRATSLRTYLGNLRAGGFVTTKQGRHRATAAGVERAKGCAPIPYGTALLSRSGPVETSALVGTATGMRATSVRTYVGNLVRRRLIVRPSLGRVALAPWMTSNASKENQ